MLKATFETKTDSNLTHFGFKPEAAGVHTARTMMLEDLSLLLTYVKNPKASKGDYIKAIEVDNCLGKRSGMTRTLSAKHLVELYSLDPSMTIFRVLLFFWKRDEEGHPLLALLCAHTRDSLLRLSAPFILKHPPGAIISREVTEEYIESKNPGRFSEVTLKSVAKNINSTWTKSGHLSGRVNKVRIRAKTTVGSTAYALFLGYLSGSRGEALFHTDYTRLLDCPVERAIELAEAASRRGWIVFKRIGNVIEIVFPNLLTAQELEWIRE